MNWKLIGIFTFTLFIILSALGIAFGFVLAAAFLPDQNPVLFVILQSLASFLVGAAAFVLLGMKQQSRPFLHALVVALAYSIISISLDLFFAIYVAGKQDSVGEILSIHASSTIWFFASMVCGISIGIRLGDKKMTSVHRIASGDDYES